IIRIYAWALPFWTLVEVVTASVRAKRKFGPEIRVRIAYEQGLRLVAGVALFFIGFETFGLFYAHLFSIIVASLLALKLVGRFYNWNDVITARIDGPFLKEFLSFSAMMMPANFIKKMFIVGSVIIVNKALGADAAAIYGLGRHISSVLQVVHLSFEYVMAPFASLKNALAKKAELQSLYTFTTRLIAVLVLPFGVVLIYISRDILTVFRPDYAAATGVIIVLTAGRITEALMGTSAAVVEMLGHRALPLLNNALGLLTLFVLQYYLKVDYGIMGIAIATAVGFNVISILSLMEAYFIYGLSAWNRKTWHPLLVSLGLSIFMGVTFYLADYLPHYIQFSYALVSIFFALMFLVRFGLSLEDAKALGRIGRWFRGKAVAP
ncbi:MAG: oligosaccharide flippase family protein, partial [Alphaproteobacteria bacterium]